LTNIEVLKLDLAGTVTRRYEGRELRRTDHALVLEAPFEIDKPDMLVLDVVLRRGDRFVETYYDDRGYNVYEIYDRQSAALKGWYCNLSRPARFSGASVAWVDLALDLWAWPDGRTALLDEDEFAALPLERAERDRVWNAVRELEQHFRNGLPPP
jgi:predicted RNA-binding protein associated with RNAse of E/G family